MAPLGAPFYSDVQPQMCVVAMRTIGTLCSMCSNNERRRRSAKSRVIDRVLRDADVVMTINDQLDREKVQISFYWSCTERGPFHEGASSFHHKKT